MKVLLISHTCQSISEGQQKAVQLANYKDIELRVLTPDRWLHYGKWRTPELLDDAAFELQVGIVTLPAFGPAQSYLHYYPQLSKILQEFKPDIIDIWEEPWALVSAQVCRLRDRLLPASKIITETEQNIDKTLPFPFERIRSYTLKHADYGVGRSSEAVEMLRVKGFRGPTRRIPNAVDTEIFKPLSREDCRAALGL